MREFKTLTVWRRSQELALHVYALCDSLPPEFDALRSHICSAGLTIPAKIANGCGRGRVAGFVRMLRIARGSASALEYHLLLAKDFGVIGEADYEEYRQEIGAIKRLLTAHIRRTTPRRVHRGHVLQSRSAAAAPRTDN